MQTTGGRSSFSIQSSPSRRHRDKVQPMTTGRLAVGAFQNKKPSAWVNFLVIALLWHAFLAILPWSRWLETDRPQTSSPIKIESITPEQLAQVKQEWRKKTLLINQDPNPPQEAPKPKDARFESDRNRTVEKEERARLSQVVPQKQIGTYQPETQPPSEPIKTRETKPPLKNIGIPFKLDANAPWAYTPDAQNAPAPSQAQKMNGGDQTILDPSIPEGERNALTTEQSIYYSFHSRIYQAIGPLWQRRIYSISTAKQLAPGDYITVTELIFDTKGKIVGLGFLEKSGVPEYDQAAIASINQVARFPNPPRDLLDENGRYRFVIPFRVYIDGRHIPDFR